MSAFDPARQRGVMRLSSMREAGVSRRAIESALADGRLVRVRNGWVATPDADPMLVAAARAGVVLGCVTQAKREGLWVIEGDAPHVVAPPHSGRVAFAGARIHWSAPIVPRHPDALEDPIANVLSVVAQCQPFEVALGVMESALRQAKVDRGALERLDLPAVARRVLEAADPFADSGLETLVVPRLRWLRLPLRRQIWILGRRVDLLIGDRLVLQIDGGHHVGPQRDQDNAHDAELRLRGYTVIRVSYRQVIDRWHEVQEFIQHAVAQGLHRADRGVA